MNKFDILFISETWLSQNNLIDIDGFMNISCVNRTTNIGIRNEGGIAIFCKKYLFGGLTIENELNFGIVILTLKKDFFAISNDIYICFSYIPHEKSNYYQICDIDFHELIEGIVLELKEKGSVFVCGDLNSRIGEVSDILYNDELEKYIDSVEHVDNPIISNRCSMDKCVNLFGRKLLQLCYNTGLTVPNGRLGNDTNGKYTFCTSKGRSVNDYLLVSPSDYKLIGDFDILEFNEFSDHSPLLFEFNLINNRPENTLPKVKSFIKWNNNRNSDFIESLRLQETAPPSLVTDISNEENINDAVYEFSRILYDTAFEHF